MSGPPLFFHSPALPPPPFPWPSAAGAYAHGVLMPVFAGFINDSLVSNANDRLVSNGSVVFMPLGQVSLKGFCGVADQ